jgi:hypothetical protein
MIRSMRAPTVLTGELGARKINHIKTPIAMKAM